MRSDRDQTGKTPRRTPSAPVPGMPYRLRPNREGDPAIGQGHEFELVESIPAARDGGLPPDAYNPWEAMGWQGGETAFPVTQEPEVLQEERYFKPMLDLDRKMPEFYNAYDGSDEPAGFDPGGSTLDFAADEPEYFEEPPPPVPVPTLEKRRREPWRIAVVLSCVVWLVFSAVEVYRIAQDVIRSEAQLREYRELYLRENNVDFTQNAKAVALRPAGETYPPTASPVPVSTPTPTARIAQNDPLIAAMSDGIDAEQSVAPGGETPAPRFKLDRYPNNPLLIIREEIVSQQELNADVIGRLVIGGLLDETVVMRNNTYYLNHRYTGDYSGYGAVFADEKLNFRYPPENIVLYGRTSNEGKTFAPLKNYVDQGIEFAKQHAFLTFTSLYEEARYVIIAVIQSSNNPTSGDYFDALRLSFDTDEDMLAYVADAMGQSLYGFNVGVQATDRLLTLVTISDGTDENRIVILCRMLREGEGGGYIQSTANPAP